MATADELRAQLKVVELEEKLVKAKEGKPDKKYRDLKLKVREARREYREAREA